MSSNNNTDCSEKPNSSLLRGTAIVSALTLVSRIFGFIRDLLVAHLFGAGMFADAFFVAFRIPNLLRSFVAEGALTSAFVPVFTSALKKGQSEAFNALRSITGLLLIITCGLTVIGIFFSPEIVSAFAPGFSSDPKKQNLCIQLTQIMMPYIIFISLIAMLSAALNSIHIYGVAALSQVIMNLVLILGALVAFAYDPVSGCYILAISVVLGGIAQVVFQIPTVRKNGFSIMPSSKVWTSHTKELLKLMAPALIGASIYQLSIFISTLLASLLQEGSVSWLFYADRVAQLPIGIYSVALTSVLLPALSHAHSNQDSSSFQNRLIDSLRFTSFILIPVSFYIFFFAHPLVTVLFERGKFDAYSSLMTANAIQGLALGIWWTSCYSIVIRAFIAKKDTTTSTLIGAFSLIINIILSIILMGPPAAGVEGAFASSVLTIRNYLGEIFPLFTLGPTGLTLASSAASAFSLLIASLLLTKRESVEWSAFAQSGIKALLSGMVAVALCSLVTYQSSPLINLSFGTLIFSTGYFGCSYLLKSKELKETFSTISRIRNRA